MTNEMSPEEIRKKQEDQQYYDALFAGGFFDIDDVEKMRNLAVIKNGEVTYPLYDFILGGKPPVYENGKVRSADAPAPDAVKRKLAELAREGELYYYYDDFAKEAVLPQKIEISVQKDKSLTASLSEFSLYDDPETFPKPGEKPEGLKGWHWFANLITGGWAYREEKEENVRRWEKEKRLYAKVSEDRKAFLDNKSVREQEDAVAKERAKIKDVREYAGDCLKRMTVIYGVQPQKTGAKNDNVIDLIQDTPYELPEGFTEELTSALGPMAMCDQQIAVLASQSDERKKKNPGKGLDKAPLQTLMLILSHASEDVYEDRDNTMNVIGDCYVPARNKLKEALDDYRLNKKANKLGEIIAQGGELFANRYSFEGIGFAKKLYVGMKCNAAIIDLLNNHADILNAAKEKGLSDKTLRTMQAQKNIVEIYEKNMTGMDCLFLRVSQNEEKTADDLANYLLNKMINNVIVRQTKERDTESNKVYFEMMQKAMKSDNKAEIIVSASNASLEYQCTYPTSSLFDDFGKKTPEEMRSAIKQNDSFKEMLREIVQNKNIAVLGDAGKVNRLTNELSEKVIHAADNNAETKNGNKLEKEKIREEMLKNAQTAETTKGETTIGTGK